jgi:hypothetical protein
MIGCDQSKAKDKEHKRKWAGIIIEKELTDHPNAVGKDPRTNGQVVDQFLQRGPT